MSAEELSSTYVLSESMNEKRVVLRLQIIKGVTQHGMTSVSGSIRMGH